MEDIVRSVYHVEYLKPWFAHGRGNAKSLKEALTVHTLDLCGKSVLGYIPWKAMEVRYLLIKHKEYFLQDCKLKIDNLWQIVSTLGKDANPRLE